MTWLVRGLLAATLLFGSEILLWTDPGGRVILDWLRLGLGYLALAALLLDLAARFRIRDIFGLLALAGVYGLLNSLALNPTTALNDVPRTWATRVLGAHTLMGLVALVLFLALTAGNLKRLPVAALVMGLLWGIWARWLAEFTEITPAVPLLTDLLLYAGGSLLLMLLLLWLASRMVNLLSPDALRLKLIEGLIVVGVLAGLIIIQLDRIDTVSLIVLLALVAYCTMLIWFEARPQGVTLIDDSLPLQLQSFTIPVISALLFLVTGVVAHSLPFTTETVPIELFIALFAGFGLVWLPTISLVMGIRAYRRMTRQRRL
jgi:hypothetical protein